MKRTHKKPSMNPDDVYQVFLRILDAFQDWGERRGFDADKIKGIIAKQKREINRELLICDALWCHIEGLEGEALIKELKKFGGNFNLKNFDRRSVERVMERFLSEVF